MLSGNGSGLYDAHEWPELARSLVTLLVVLANDDDEWDYEDDSYHHHDSFCEDDLGISVPQAQFDVGLSYFISPSLAVGARYLFSEDFRDNELSRLWGGGPELTLFMGQDASRIRPFVGGGLMYTRGRSRRGAAEFEDGTALHWRACPSPWVRRVASSSRAAGATTGFPLNLSHWRVASPASGSASQPASISSDTFSGSPTGPA